MKTQADWFKLRVIMSPDQTPGLVEAYARRNSQFGPATYSDSSLNDKIMRAGRLKSLSQGSNIADLMSGPGKLGQSLEMKLLGRNHQYFYLDFTPSQLNKIPDAPNRTKVFSDIRLATLPPNTFDVALARYSFKDLPESDQERAFSSVHESIRPGGRLVLVDMVAPTEELQGWTIAQHSLKQQLSGRNIAKEGQCHIRTNAGWNHVLSEFGFYPAVTDGYLSKVNTLDWLTSGQVDENQLDTLNKFIVDASETVKSAFNIRQDTDGVKIDFPVTIISAWKPYAN